MLHSGTKRRRVRRRCHGKYWTMNYDCYCLVTFRAAAADDDARQTPDGLDCHGALYASEDEALNGAGLLLYRHGVHGMSMSRRE